MADLEKGELMHLSLSSEGRLTLAPVVQEVFDPSVTFLWAEARDSKGNLYVGGGGLGGGKAKLAVIDPQAREECWRSWTASRCRPSPSIGRIACTPPRRRTARSFAWTASGKPSQVFYDPKQKYIWALAFSRSGDLFVATGDQGEIHRVTPAGVGSVFFRTEETHARSMTIDANDNLIVGTDPSGLVLRITPSGAGFVLYQTAKREITAVAVGPDGSVYAAGIGNRQTAPATRSRCAARASSRAG